MANQIEVVADWATAATAAGNYVTKPSADKRAAGWVGGATPDVPPAPHFNWLHRTAYENIGWLIDSVYFSDTARWERTGLTASPSPNFPSGTGTGVRFGLGHNTILNGQQGYEKQFAFYDGADTMMFVANSYTTWANGAATGYVYLSRDAGRTFTFSQPTALSGGNINSIGLNSINGTVFCSFTPKTGGSGGIACLKYSTDYGTTWSSTIFTSTVTDWDMAYFWKEEGRYYVFSSTTDVYISASGSITGTYGGVSMGSLESHVGNGPVSNNRYMMWVRDTGAAKKLYWATLGAATSSISSITLTSSIPALTAIPHRGVAYLPHNDTFVIMGYEGFAVLDGATGNISTAAHWNCFFPTTRPGTGLSLVPSQLWYDAKRELYYYSKWSTDGGRLYACPSLSGDWRELPAYQNFGLDENTKGENIMFKVQKASYVDEYYVSLGAPTGYLDGHTDSAFAYAALNKVLARGFPVVY